jgi:hypothetical protein
MEYLAGALVVGLVLLFVGWPLLRQSPGAANVGLSERQPEEERAEIYRELVELELDHRIGKVTAADFRELSDGLLERAAALIVAEDAQTHDAEEQVEREIGAMREALRLTPSKSASEAPE